MCGFDSIVKVTGEDEVVRRFVDVAFERIVVAAGESGGDVISPVISRTNDGNLLADYESMDGPGRDLAGADSFDLTFGVVLTGDAQLTWQGWQDSLKEILGAVEDLPEFRRALIWHVGCFDIDINQAPDFSERTL